MKVSSYNCLQCRADCTGTNSFLPRPNNCYRVPLGCVCVCVCVCVTSSRWWRPRGPWRRPAILSLRWTSARPYHPTTTPLGTLELAVGSDQSTLTASSGYGGRSTWRALTVCFTAMVPSCHSPQGFQAWAWPAHPTTVSWPTKQDPSYCLGSAQRPC